MMFNILITFVLLRVIVANHGQAVNLTGPTSVTEGQDATFICNVTGIPFPTFVWNDVSVTPTQQIFGNDNRFTQHKYDNFRLSPLMNSDGNYSIMIIVDVEFEDEGIFVCVASGMESGPISLTVTDLPWFGDHRSFIVIAVLAILLTASVIFNISQFSYIFLRK